MASGSPTGEESKFWTTGAANTMQVVTIPPRSGAICPQTPGNAAVPGELSRTQDTNDWTGNTHHVHEAFCVEDTSSTKEGAGTTRHAPEVIRVVRPIQDSDDVVRDVCRTIEDIHMKTQNGEAPFRTTPFSSILELEVCLGGLEVTVAEIEMDFLPFHPDNSEFKTYRAHRNYWRKRMKSNQRQNQAILHTRWPISDSPVVGWPEVNGTHDPELGAAVENLTAGCEYCQELFYQMRYDVSVRNTINPESCVWQMPCNLRSIRRELTRLVRIDRKVMRGLPFNAAPKIYLSAIDAYRAQHSITMKIARSVQDRLLMELTDFHNFLAPVVPATVVWQIYTYLIDHPMPLSLVRPLGWDGMADLTAIHGGSGGPSTHVTRLDANDLAAFYEDLVELCVSTGCVQDPTVVEKPGFCLLEAMQQLIPPERRGLLRSAFQRSLNALNLRFRTESGDGLSFRDAIELHHHMSQDEGGSEAMAGTALFYVTFKELRGLKSGDFSATRRELAKFVTCARHPTILLIGSYWSPKSMPGSKTRLFAFKHWVCVNPLPLNVTLDPTPMPIETPATEIVLHQPVTPLQSQTGSALCPFGALRRLLAISPDDHYPNLGSLRRSAGCATARIVQQPREATLQLYFNCRVQPDQLMDPILLAWKRNGARVAPRLQNVCRGKRVDFAVWVSGVPPLALLNPECCCGKRSDDCQCRRARVYWRYQGDCESAFSHLHDYNTYEGPKCYCQVSLLGGGRPCYHENEWVNNLKSGLGPLGHYPWINRRFFHAGPTLVQFTSRKVEKSKHPEASRAWYVEASVGDSWVAAITVYLPKPEEITGPFKGVHEGFAVYDFIGDGHRDQLPLHDTTTFTYPALSVTDDVLGALGLRLPGRWVGGIVDRITRWVTRTSNDSNHRILHSGLYSSFAFRDAPLHLMECSLVISPNTGNIIHRSHGTVTLDPLSAKRLFVTIPTETGSQTLPISRTLIDEVAQKALRITPLTNTLPEATTQTVESIALGLLTEAYVSEPRSRPEITDIANTLGNTDGIRADLAVVHAILAEEKVKTIRSRFGRVTLLGITTGEFANINQHFTTKLGDPNIGGPSGFHPIVHTNPYDHRKEVIPPSFTQPMAQDVLCVHLDEIHGGSGPPQHITPKLRRAKGDGVPFSEKLWVSAQPELSKKRCLQCGYIRRRSGSTWPRGICPKCRITNALGNPYTRPIAMCVAPTHYGVTTTPTPFSPVITSVKFWKPKPVDLDCSIKIKQTARFRREPNLQMAPRALGIYHSKFPVAFANTVENQIIALKTRVCCVASKSPKPGVFKDATRMLRRRVLDFAEEKFRITRLSYDVWKKQFPPARRDTFDRVEAQDQIRPFSIKKICRFELMVKKEHTGHAPSPETTFKYQGEDALFVCYNPVPTNPRAIQMPHNKLHTALGPWLRPASNMLHNVCHPRAAVSYAGGMTPIELDSWAEDKLTNPAFAGWGSFEGDYKAHDRTVSGEALAMIDEWLFWRGFPRHGREAQILRGCHQAKGRSSAGVSYKGPKMNASGVDHTALRSGLCNVVAMGVSLVRIALEYELGVDPGTKRVMTLPRHRFHRILEQYYRLIVMGDDSLGVFHPVLKTGVETKLAAYIGDFGFEIVMKIHRSMRYGTFLGQRPYPTSEGHKWGPTIGRRVYKHHWQLDPMAGDMEWLELVSRAELSAYPYVPILADLNLYVQRELIGVRSNRNYVQFWQHCRGVSHIDAVRAKNQTSAACTLDTYMMLNEVYGITQSMIDDMNLKLAVAHEAGMGLPLLLDHEVIDLVLRTDGL